MTTVQAPAQRYRRYTVVMASGLQVQFRFHRYPKPRVLTDPVTDQFTGMTGKPVGGPSAQPQVRWRDVIAVYEEPDPPPS